jgi:hypothetical protein
LPVVPLLRCGLAVEAITLDETAKESNHGSFLKAARSNVAGDVL